VWWVAHATDASEFKGTQACRSATGAVHVGEFVYSAGESSEASPKYTLYTSKYHTLHRILRQRVHVLFGQSRVTVLFWLQGCARRAPVCERMNQLLRAVARATGSANGAETQSRELQHVSASVHELF
jgi:hypothetical protein